MTDETQDWANTDGANAFHLIERHGADWFESGKMMEAWAKARFDVEGLQCRLELADMRINALVRAKGEAERRLFDSTQAALQRISDFGQLQDAAEAVDLSGLKLYDANDWKDFSMLGDIIPCADGQFYLAADVCAMLEAQHQTKAAEAPSAPAEQAQVFIEQSGDPSVQRIRELERDCAVKQATIDRLMLEYCPGEMSAGQKETWEPSQRAVSGEAKPWDGFCAEKSGNEHLDASDFLLNAALTWWEASKRANVHGAIKWLLGDDGALLIYTRSEYRERLLENIDMLGQEPVVFSAQPDSERDAALTSVQLDALYLAAATMEALKIGNCGPTLRTIIAIASATQQTREG